MEKDKVFLVGVLGILGFCICSSFFSLFFQMSHHLLQRRSHLVVRHEMRMSLCLCNASPKKVYIFGVLRFFLKPQGFFRAPCVESRFKARLKKAF